MHPASLVPRSGKDLVERLPEAECTVTNGVFWSDLQSPSFHIDEKFAPALRAFPNANLETDEFLLALRRSSPNKKTARRRPLGRVPHLSEFERAETKFL